MTQWKKKQTCLVVHIRLSLLYIKDHERVWKVWKWELLARYKSWSGFFFLYELTTKCGVIVAYPKNFVATRWLFSIT